MNERNASFYERRGALYLTATVQTDQGVGLLDGPCTTLAADAPAHEIGEAVLEALSRSGRIVPHPTEWKNLNLDSPVLEAAGVKRWNTFYKGARCVSITIDDDGYRLTPTENEGRDGFGYLPEANDVRLPATADAAALGRAVQQALAACK